MTDQDPVDGHYVDGRAGALDVQEAKETGLNLKMADQVSDSVSSRKYRQKNKGQWS